MLCGMFLKISEDQKNGWSMSWVDADARQAVELGDVSARRVADVAVKDVSAMDALMCQMSLKRLIQ